MFKYKYKVLSVIIAVVLAMTGVVWLGGNSAKAEGNSSVVSAPVYRLYNPNSGEHHYTLDSNERNVLIRYGWKDEGVAWNAPAGGKSVYRLYNPYATTYAHHYTMDANEKSYLVSIGWSYEGIGWTSYEEADKIPVYRVYNPNSGEHHYTADANEKNVLVSYGWNYEGVAWGAAPDDAVEEPSKPEKPVTPEEPSEPETPVEPSKPEEPVTPTQPAIDYTDDSKYDSSYLKYVYSGDQIDWASAPTAADYNSGRIAVPAAVRKVVDDYYTTHPYETRQEFVVEKVYYAVYYDQPVRIFQVKDFCPITEKGEMLNTGRPDSLSALFTNDFQSGKKSRYEGPTATYVTTKEEVNAKVNERKAIGLTEDEAYYRIMARALTDPDYAQGSDKKNGMYRSPTNRVGVSGWGSGCAGYASDMQDFAMDYGFTVTARRIPTAAELGRPLTMADLGPIRPGDELRWGSLNGSGHSDVVVRVRTEGDVFSCVTAAGGGVGVGQPASGYGITEFALDGSLGTIPAYVVSFWPSVQ